MIDRKRLRKLLLRPMLAAALFLGVFVSARYVSGNFGATVPGRVYRSGQMSARQMTDTVRSRGIRTVLNLRGPNPDQAWYRDERAAVLDAGATQVDFAMASDQWLSRSQVRTIVTLLDEAEPPVLIHCQWGSERTGLVAAMAELLRPGGTVASARRQFSAWYLYLPIKDGLTMRGHLDRYEHWLATTGQTHAPRVFRSWVERAYQPGFPSREDWPFDPYPLVVISRPATANVGMIQVGSSERGPAR
jgi:protein tyrosine phosphatase (PTP) superfamily phosphohydrolase (DUF442 family)